MTTRVTFNPENWIDDVAEYTLLDSEHVLFADEVFELTHNAPLLSGDANPRFDFHSITVNLRGLPFATLTRFGDDLEWTAAGELSRQHSDPRTLTAILAANLV